MKGQHVGGRSSDKSYISHWRFHSPTNLVTSSDTQGGAPGLALPRLSTQGGLHIEVPQTLSIETRWYRLRPNILGDDVAADRTQAIQQDIRVHLTNPGGGGGGDMQ